MFPDDLKTLPASSALVVMDQSAPRGGTWFKPSTLEELLGLLYTYAEQGGCKIVVGNTEVGIGELRSIFLCLKQNNCESVPWKAFMPFLSFHFLINYNITLLPCPLLRNQIQTGLLSSVHLPIALH